MPPRLHPKAGKWWHVSKKDRKWTDLGADLASALAQYATLEGSGAPAGSFAELADRFVVEGMGTLMPKTKKNYTLQKPKLVAAFGHMPVNAIKSMHIAAYLDKHPSKTSANREIALMSSMFRKAIRWGLAESNPCLGVELNPEYERKRYVTDEEFTRVRSVMPEWIKCMMDLAYITALRQRVLLDLRVDDFTTSGLLVTLNKTGKGKVRRKLFQPDEFLGTTFQKAVEIRKDKDNQWLFPSRSGEPYTTDGFQSIWQRRRLASGVKDFHFHDIRAKALTDAEEMSLDSQLLAGHATRAMTERYIKFRRPTMTPVLRRSMES